MSSSMKHLLLVLQESQALDFVERVARENKSSKAVSWRLKFQGNHGRPREKHGKTMGKPCFLFQFAHRIGDLPESSASIVIVCLFLPIKF